MPLWKNGAFVEDGWRVAGAEEELPSNAALIVPLARWLAEREAIAGRPGPLGLLIAPGEDWSAARGDLSRFDVIALLLPAFTDGRAFSTARLLRDRENYKGEIRAVGSFILDQMPFLKRVGFDAFDVTDPIVKAALDRGEWPEVDLYTQPVAASREAPAGTRPWTRQRAPD